MQEAIAKTGLQPALFALAPSQEAPLRYVAHVQFTDEPSEDQARKFLETIDRVLSEEAWEYATHRRAGDLAAPELVWLESHSLDAHRREEPLLGLRLLG